MLLEETDHTGTSRLLITLIIVCVVNTSESLTPPFNQMARGAVEGLLRASKNQNLGLDELTCFARMET
jgi:hypothetical protein